MEDLQVPIEFFFPASSNQNLTAFLAEYNVLSPFRNNERKKREEMLAKSGMSCVYWDTSDLKWSTRGCSLISVDNTHIKCACNHLSSFAISFSTPKLTIDAPLLENSTVKADPER